MARASILTIEPISLGGVPVMARAIYDLYKSAGHQPELLYTDTDSVPSSGRWTLLRYYARNWLTRREQRNSMDGIAMPSWPVPQWLWYYTPLVSGFLHLRRGQIHSVVGGSAHIGLPLAIMKKPFVAWIATAYYDELHGRALAGDQWATQLLNSPQWTRLQSQERFVLERATAIIALSPNTAGRLAELIPDAARKIRTILCPVDVNYFHPADSAATNPIGAPFLLFTARITDPRKNVSMLLRAFAQVHNRQPALKLVFIGDAPLPSQLALRDSLSLGDSVMFLPPTPREHLLRYYQSAELFVLSSTQEGLGISFLEALACGLPVLTTRCGGPEGIVEDGVNGRLVTNNDPRAFAEAILDTLANRSQLAAMRARARETAIAQFAYPIVEQRLRHTLAEVYPEYF